MDIEGYPKLMVSDRDGFERLPRYETLEDFQELLPWTWRQQI
jgi:hypothetical protein